MPQDADLLRQLTSLLNGSLPLDEFRHWFSNALWVIESEGDEDKADVACLVENRLAEFSGSHIDEARLRAVLGDDLKQTVEPIDLAGRVS